MLSRIAGSLFWIGRYLERAENISRILEVKLQQFLEDPTVDERAASSSLLGAMGLDMSEHTDELIDAGATSGVEAGGGGGGGGGGSGAGNGDGGPAARK